LGEVVKEEGEKNLIVSEEQSSVQSEKL